MGGHEVDIPTPPSYQPVLGDVYPLDVSLQDDPAAISAFVGRLSLPGSIVILHTPSTSFRSGNWTVGPKSLAPRRRWRASCWTWDLDSLWELCQQLWNTKWFQTVKRPTKIPQPINNDHHRIYITKITCISQLSDIRFFFVNCIEIGPRLDTA